MVCDITGVLYMLKDQSKSQSIIRFLLPRQVTARRKVVVDVIGNIRPSSDPPLLLSLELSRGIHHWLHSKVELTVGFLTVNNVEPIRYIWFGVRYSEVEPLVVVISVDVSIQEEIILIRTDLKGLVQ